MAQGAGRRAKGKEEEKGRREKGEGREGRIAGDQIKAEDRC